MLEIGKSNTKRKKNIITAAAAPTKIEVVGIISKQLILIKSMKLLLFPSSILQVQYYYRVTPITILLIR
jgi:hypothetical protein